MDPDDVTAIELAAAYAQRWEYEISLREIENYRSREARFSRRGNL